MARPVVGALAVALGVAVVCAPAAAQEGAALGLCSPQAKHRDGYTQALCDGEAALHEGRAAAALERFRFAADLPCPAATNELAWAGIAAAYCRAGNIDEGRRWAAHFSGARRLWLGQFDCGAGGSRAPSPFVHSRMCGEALLADYTLVRTNAQGPTFSTCTRG